jgi:hypothetical protein
MMANLSPEAGSIKVESLCHTQTSFFKAWICAMGDEQGKPEAA